MNLKFTERKRKAEIKVSSPDTYKVYRALVKCEDDIKEEDLNKLQSLHMIQQRTPIRVSHRRADKIREKEVKNIDLWEILLNKLKEHDVKFIKVKGHADNPYNNKCDKIAVEQYKNI